MKRKDFMRKTSSGHLRRLSQVASLGQGNSVSVKRRAARRKALRLESLESRRLLAAVIAPVDAQLQSVGSSYLQAEYGANGENWYNGSGLSDASIVETGDPIPETWPEHVAGNNLNRVSRIRDAAAVNTLTFDLGGTFEVSGMVLWNSTESGQTDRGFQNTVLSYSTDGGLTFSGSDTLAWTQRIADQSPNQGNTPTPPIATFAPEVQMLPSSVDDVTHIRMDVDNFSSEAIVMASEIRFFGEVDTGISLSLTADMVLDSQALVFPDTARFSRDPNGSPYRTEPLLTHNGYQFATWYNRGTGNGVAADIGIYIARRDLSGNTWEVMDTGLEMVNGKRIWDSHNVISLGIASDGRLHLAYDMHKDDLRYATTPAGRATGSNWHVFNAERDSLNSTSASLTDVTYPRFINNGDDMLMTFREGGSGNGDIELIRYDSSAALPHRWVGENGNTSGDLTQTIISGAGSYTNPIDNSVSTTRNAYLNGMDVDSNGRIHMTWTWRENSQGSNHDINYAYSDDNGVTWRNNAGANLGSTVSISSPGIIISSLDERQALINQQGQAVDGEGGVHALMYHRRQEPGFEWQQGDGLFFKGDSAYFHYYRDPLSGTWTDSMLPTDRVVGSRPSIGFDRDNNVYAAYLTRANGNDILRIASAEKLAAGGYAPWEVIWEDSRDWLGTPLLDQERLLSDDILSVFLQENTTSDSLTGTNLHVLEFSIDGLEVPGELTVTIADASVSEADGVGATTATVSRNTDTTDPLTVTLVSDDTTEATVLGTITIPAGQTTSDPFNLDAIDDAIVDGTQTVTVTASADAHADGLDTVDVTDNDTIEDSTIVIAPVAASLQSDSSSYLEYGTDGSHWYNGSGLSDATVVETGDPIPATWPDHVAGNNQTRVSRIRSAPEVNRLTFDLGGTFDVSGMVLWNSTERAGSGTLQTDRGFENTVLSYSTDGGATFTGSDTLTWTERSADASVNQGDNPTAPIATYAPEVMVLPSAMAGVTHIRMDVDNFSDAGADNIVMASEIRFFGQVQTTPPKVDGLWLVNSDNDQDIVALTEGLVISLPDLATTNLNVRATTDLPVGSVGFQLSGATTRNQSESNPPYALFGDTNGDFDAGAFAPGEHSLVVTPYSGGGLTGTVGTVTTVNFKVVAEDFGDAPASFGTLRSDDGARHYGIGPRLGDMRDLEIDGQPSTDSDGDGSDEDGVLFGTIGIGHPLAGLNIDLQNAASAKVDAWIDFDGDGIWQADEKILDDVAVLSGLQTLNYNLPATAPIGQTIARVRLSSAGGLQPTGPALDGEVEDYVVTISEAIDPTVESVVINQGQVQRSRVSELTVAFNTEVTAPLEAFAVRNRNTNELVNLSMNSQILGDKTVVSLVFLPGPSVVNASTGLHTLGDGNYELVITGAMVTAGGTSMSADHVFGSQAADSFFRYYGDADGDRDVDGQDYGRFGLTFLRSSPDTLFNQAFDFDGDNDVDGQDYGQFGQRFLRQLSFE